MAKTKLPAIGIPFAGGIFAGEMTIDSVRYALVVALKAEGEKLNLEYKKKLPGTADGTDSDDDGLANFQRLIGPNYPAAEFCRSLKAGGFDDWYLLSRDELAMLWRNLGPKRKNTPELFREGGAEAFTANWYWSSTEFASYSTNAWLTDFNYGYQFTSYKDFSAGVRAVRRFKI